MPQRAPACPSVPQRGVAIVTRQTKHVWEANISYRYDWQLQHRDNVMVDIFRMAEQITSRY